MKKVVWGVLAGAFLFFFSAAAQGAGGVYLGGSLGIGMLTDTDTRFPGFDAALFLYEERYNSGDNHFDVGYSHAMKFEIGKTYSLAMGYTPGAHSRLEAELVFQKNDLDSATFTYDEDLYFTSYGTPVVSDHHAAGEDIVSGNISCLAFMVNGYFDFTNPSAFTPFVGAGIGYAKMKYDISSAFMQYYLFEFDERYNPVYLEQGGEAEVFAWQLTAGVGYALSEQLTLDLKYRYFATEDPEFGDMTMSYVTHNFYLGIRVGF